MIALDLDDIFGALSSVPRRQIIAFLSQTALSTTDLAGRFSLSPPAVSRHLALLQRAGLVVSERLLGEIRLQWWREALAALYDGQAAAPRHPVVDDLQPAIAAYALSATCSRR